MSSILYAHTRFILLLAIALRWEIPNTVQRYGQYFQQDLAYCSHCFERQVDVCANFHATLVDDDATLAAAAANGDTTLSMLSAATLLNLLRGIVAGEGRNSAIMRAQQRDGGTQLVVAKRFGRYVPQAVLFEQSQAAAKRMLQYFITAPREDVGFQLCPEPTAAMQRFIFSVLLQSGEQQQQQQQQQKPQHQRTLYDLDEFTIMLHMLDNAQPLMVAALHARGWPVPRPLARCGFTHYEAYAGKPLLYYYDADVPVKLDIARQLLRAALLFTEGFDDFHFYITDLSADNVVYDEQTRRLAVVDLDTLLVVDVQAVARAAAPATPTVPHRHDYIECDNCFAYVPQDICTHTSSDLNLFAACQLLREDLQRNRRGGFLSSLPVQAYPQLSAQIDACVDCAPPACWDRFNVTRGLIETLDLILLKKFNYT